MFLKAPLLIDNVRVLKASVDFVQAQRSYLSRRNCVFWLYYGLICQISLRLKKLLRYEFYSHGAQFPGSEMGSWGNPEDWGHDDGTFYCWPLQQTAHELFSQWQIGARRTNRGREFCHRYDNEKKKLKKWRDSVVNTFYYINTSELPSELSRENFISSHVKRSPSLLWHNKSRLFHWCLYNKQSIPCPLVDINFIFSCSTQYFSLHSLDSPIYTVKLRKPCWFAI